MQWTVLVAMKAVAAAKSRLIGAVPGPEAHRSLVLAMRADTVAAAGAADPVARVVAVVDLSATAPAGAAHTFVQTAPGLNAGLAEAADWARRRWPADGVAMLVADLPALRSAELAEALVAVGAQGGGFVADSDETGTTLLASAPGTAIEPRFGPGSAARHAAQVRRLPAGPGLRRDVDVAADLDDALSLGLGAHTRVALTARSA